jgi:hypothetical protein
MFPDASVTGVSFADALQLPQEALGERAVGRTARPEAKGCPSGTTRPSVLEQDASESSDAEPGSRASASGRPSPGRRARKCPAAEANGRLEAEHIHTRPRKKKIGTPDVKSDRRSLLQRVPSGASTDPLGALDDPAAGGIGASR